MYVRFYSHATMRKALSAKLREQADIRSTSAVYTVRYIFVTDIILCTVNPADLAREFAYHINSIRRRDI